MKNSFVLYTSYGDQFDMLTDAQAGALIKAIFQLSRDDQIRELDAVTSMAFSFIKSQLDIDNQKYQDTIAKRVEAGKASGKVRAQKAEDERTKRTHVNFVQQDNFERTKRTDNVDVNVNDDVDVDVVDDDDVKTKKESGLKPTREKFVPPTVEEVAAYCAERGNAVDAESFVDFYQSKGWMVGKNRMKDWKSAVRNWERTDSRRQGQAAEPDRYEEVDRWASAISQRS